MYHTWVERGSVRGAGMTQWWERSPPTNVTRVWFRPGAKCELSLLWVLAWLRGIFSGFSAFSPFTKTNTSKFQFDQDRGRKRIGIWRCWWENNWYAARAVSATSENTRDIGLTWLPMLITPILKSLVILQSDWLFSSAVYSPIALYLPLKQNNKSNFKVCLK